MTSPILLIALIALLLGAPSATAQNDWPLVWADEFTGQGLPDTSNWRYDVGGGGWGNDELQHYTAQRLQNARIENGLLVIEAHREKFQDRAYTSARLVSKRDWTYGRFEIRAKMPVGRGTWPALWMLPTHNTYGGEHYWPDNGEIDILEQVGYQPDVVHFSVHTRAYHHSIGTQKTNHRTLANISTQFHVYAAEWTPEEIRFFVDEKRYFTFANERLTDKKANYQQWPFDRPFHLLLNIAVGGTWGGAQGVDEGIWPQKLEVDYVRVYQPPADTTVEKQSWGKIKQDD